MDILSITNKSSVSSDAKIYTKDGSDFVTTTFDALYNKSSAKTNIEKSVSDANARIDTTNNTVAELDNYARAKANGIVLQSQGEMVTVNDSSDDYVVNLKPYGKSEQDSTAGTQLINWKNGLVGSGGLTPTVLEDGGIRVTGTPITQYAQVLSRQTSLPVGTYYISGGSLGAGCVVAQVTIDNADGTRKHYINKAFNVLDDDTVHIIIQTGSSLDVVDYVIYPMLNEGTNPLPFEPYTGGRPTPRPDHPQEIRSTVISEVRSCGKNLLNMSGAVGGNSAGVTVDVNDDGTYTVNCTNTDTNINVWLKGGWDATTPVLTLPAGTYSFKDIALFKGMNQLSSPFTSTEEILITGVRCKGLEIGTYNNKIMYPMLNKGDTALPFEPYTETVATLSEPITLNAIPTDSDGNFTDASGQQWIADYIDVAKGKVVRCVYEKIFKGDEYIELDNSYNGIYQFNYPISNIDKYGTVLSNTFVSIPFQESWTIDNSVTIIGERIRFMTSKYDNVEDFKNNILVNTIVLYPLATPTEQDLPTEDIVALRGLKTFYSVTNVTNDSEVKGEMVLSYNADTKMYIDNKFAELAAQLV